MATTHLIEIGRRNIAHISGRENSTGRRRKEGYLEALRAHKLPVRESYILSRDYVDTDSLRQGSEAMRQLLKGKPRPDAIFCHNDPIAIGAMNVILDAGLRIPEDIAVVGCGNLNYNEWLRVPLTSIDQRSDLIGQRAGEILLGMIEGTEWPAPEKVIIESALVVRASTGGGQATAAKSSGKTRKPAKAHT
jgi:LacI family transcriptional regulator